MSGTVIEWKSLFQKYIIDGKEPPPSRDCETGWSHLVSLYRRYGMPEDFIAALSELIFALTDRELSNENLLALERALLLAKSLKHGGLHCAAKRVFEVMRADDSEILCRNIETYALIALAEIEATNVDVQDREFWQTCIQEGGENVAYGFNGMRAIDFPWVIEHLDDYLDYLSRRGEDSIVITLEGLFDEAKKRSCDFAHILNKFAKRKPSVVTLYAHLFLRAFGAQFMVELPRK